MACALFLPTRMASCRTMRGRNGQEKEERAVTQQATHQSCTGLRLTRRAWMQALLAGAAGALLHRWPEARAFELNEARLQQSMQTRYGNAGVQRLRAWQTMLAAQTGKNEAQQLEAVNTFWNTQVLGSEDSIIWGQNDYWATPLESLGKGAADCEDFVIGKYFSLAYLGVPVQRLRLIYVRARMGGVGSTQSIAHMVLGYYRTPQAEPLVLDNMIDTISPASQRSDLTPVFSFNAEGIYAPSGAVSSVDRITRWRDLLVRMQQEGFVLTS